MPEDGMSGGQSSPHGRKFERKRKLKKEKLDHFHELEPTETKEEKFDWEEKDLDSYSEEALINIGKEFNLNLSIDVGKEDMLIAIRNEIEKQKVEEAMSDT